MTRKYRLLAVDPSLTVSGWALLCADGEVLKVGLVSPPGPALPLGRRFDELQRQVDALFSQLQLGEYDYCISEGPAPLVLNPQSALKVERVRSIFESVARSYGVCVPGRINPRTVQTELLGMRGKQLARDKVKAWAQETAVRLYGERLTLLGYGMPGEGEGPKFSQDIVDALLVGTLALSRLNLCLATGGDPSSAFATRKNPAWRCSRGSGRSSGWSETDLKKLNQG